MNNDAGFFEKMGHDLDGVSEAVFGKSIKLNDTVNLNPAVLPTEISSQLTILYNRLAYGNYRELCRDLNIPVNDNILRSALEYKYVFEFRQKYGNLARSPDRKVDDAEIMRPLTDEGREEFANFYRV